MYRIVGGDGREYGPVTAEQLKTWIAEGRVNAQTKAQAEGTSEWKLIPAFPEFAEAFRSVPATAAPPIPASMPVLPPPIAAKTSGLAIASLVLGILGLCFSVLTAVPGLILGIVGLSRINRSGGRVGGQGLAIAGICVSALSMVLCPIQAGLLLPALNAAREKARRATCLSQLKGIGFAMRLYAEDNGGRYPSDAAGTTAGSLNLVTGHYLTMPKLWVCPSDSDIVPASPGASLTAQNLSYAYNGFGLTEKAEPNVPILCDRTSGDIASGAPWAGNKWTHKQDGGNILFADGHVAFTRSVNPPMSQARNP